MRFLRHLLGDTRAAAAAEMALVTPLLLILMFGSAEMGNYFLNQHALTKQVRDGARFASRLTIEDEDYDCPDNVWDDDLAPSAETQIENVVKTGTVDGTGTGRFPAWMWDADNQCGSVPTVSVDPRCVSKGDAELSGMYSTLADDNIPVVKVTAAITYDPILSAIGINLIDQCLRAESEIPVVGL